MSVQVERVETLLDRAEDAIETGDAETALSICEQALSLVPGHPGAQFVQGDALRALGRLEEACESYRAAALGRPDHASSWASLALTLFELLRWEEALRAAKRAVREDPLCPEGWWVRALLRERAGDADGSMRCLQHACWLDPHGFPLPPSLSDSEIDKLVEDALWLLHPSLREYLSNVAILLEDVPPEDVLRQYDPPASPLEILGFFSGHSLQDRSGDDPWSQLPGTIVLFRSNLERHAADRAELVEQLRITFFHEIGHFLGLDEEDLEARGLD